MPLVPFLFFFLSAGILSPSLFQHVASVFFFSFFFDFALCFYKLLLLFFVLGLFYMTNFRYIHAFLHFFVSDLTEILTSGTHLSHT